MKELPTTHSSKKSRHYLREIAAGRGIHKRTDMESLENPTTPLDINILYSLCQEESTCKYSTYKFNGNIVLKCVK